MNYANTWPAIQNLKHSNQTNLRAYLPNAEYLTATFLDT